MRGPKKNLEKVTVLSAAGVIGLTLTFSDPRKLKLRTLRGSQSHTVAREFHLIKRGSKGRLDLNSVMVSETIPALGAPDQDRSIFREFPNRCAGIGHAPFTGEGAGGTAAAGQSTQHNR
jgi:hypothetical protein